MDSFDEQDDLTDVPDRSAPDVDVPVWSLRADDLDDEVTAVVGVGSVGVVDDLDDEVTAVVGVGSVGVVDDLDDEVTAVVGVGSAGVVDDLDDEVTAVVGVGSVGVVDDLDDEVTAVMQPGVAARTATHMVPPAAVPTATSPTRRLKASAPASGVSLRDRLPESHESWQPPRRPRSAEFDPAVSATRRSMLPFAIAAILAAALLFAVVWWLVPDSADQAPTVDEPIELEIDDAN